MGKPKVENLVVEALEPGKHNRLARQRSLKQNRNSNYSTIVACNYTTLLGFCLYSDWTLPYRSFPVTPLPTAMYNTLRRHDSVTVRPGVNSFTVPNLRKKTRCVQLMYCENGQRIFSLFHVQAAFVVVQEAGPK